MSSLHDALKTLGPENWSNIPKGAEELDKYIADLFAKSELILESIPPPPSPEDNHLKPHSTNASSIASNASEISLSSSRSLPPRDEYQELQTQWGKPMKLSAKDNPLGMSVYKLGGKDGKGSWFARRSVHEGLSFGRWKKAMEQEFPTSLEAGADAPGQGNIRGIGGERIVEHKKLDGKGKMEVYQLSAQFPGPSTPRDFITLLITSTNALAGGDKDHLGPRHYMIVSKPCIHDDCSPRKGFVRGQYESVEFIREVPRVSHKAHFDHENKSTDDIPDQRLASRGDQQKSRHRSKTVSVEDDPAESNPVEWIMITRSDPGGSVPRYLVERGTPSSICGDAVKFLNWATNLNSPEEKEGYKGDDELQRRESLPILETNGIMSGLNPISAAEGREEEGEEEVSGSGFLGGVAGALQSGMNMYAPQSVLGYMPGHASKPSNVTTATVGTQGTIEEAKGDDASSTLSSVSFASARSRDSVKSESSKNTPTKDGQYVSRHEKELEKLQKQKLALDEKLNASREKAQKDSAAATEKEINAQKRAEEKHEKELKKHEERYKKDVAKLEAKKVKEAQKIEQRKKKAEEKDANKRNEALKQELDVIKKERDTLMKLVGDLQNENTRLAARLGDSPRSSQSNLSGTSPELPHGQIKHLIGEEKGNGTTKATTRSRGVSVRSSSSSLPAASK